MPSFDHEVADMRRWFESSRFAGIKRLYSAREVVEQRGSIRGEYAVARDAAEAFHARLRQLFAEKKCITTFGPFSPGQAVAMRRAGIEGIYLGGWATSAKGGPDEDPGPDLASYPLSRVPDDAYATLELGAIASESGQPARALVLLERAVRLSPRDPLTRRALQTVRAGHRVSAEALNRSILLRAEQLA